MKRSDFVDKYEMLKNLIALSNTGNPKKLAKILLTSERTVRRMIDILKQKDKTIKYDRKIASYTSENSYKPQKNGDTSTNNTEQKR